MLFKHIIFFFFEQIRQLNQKSNNGCPCHKVSQRQTRNRFSNLFVLLQLYCAMITLLRVYPACYTQDIGSLHISCGPTTPPTLPQPINRSVYNWHCHQDVCLPAASVRVLWGDRNTGDYKPLSRLHLPTSTQMSRDGLQAYQDIIKTGKIKEQILSTGRNSKMARSLKS